MDFELTFDKPILYKNPDLNVYSILKSNLKSIIDYPVDKVLDRCKYVRLARTYNLKNYKLMFYSDIKRLGIDVYFSQWQKRVIADAGAVVAIFNEMNGIPISIAFRSTTEKEFIDFSIVRTLYGYDLLEENYKFGEFIVLTEGFYDADVLRSVYKNVLATQTSNLNYMQESILRTLTDKVLILYDNDKAGEVGAAKIQKKLSDMICIKMNVYDNDKDVGDMEVKGYKNPSEKYIRQKFYREQIEDIMSMYY